MSLKVWFVASSFAPPSTLNELVFHVRKVILLTVLSGVNSWYTAVMARLTCSFSGDKYKPTIQNNQTLAIWRRGIHSVFPLQSTISSIFLPDTELWLFLALNLSWFCMIVSVFRYRPKPTQACIYSIQPWLPGAIEWNCRRDTCRCRAVFPVHLCSLHQWGKKQSQRGNNFIHEGHI